MGPQHPHSINLRYSNINILYLFHRYLSGEIVYTPKWNYIWFVNHLKLHFYFEMKIYISIKRKLHILRPFLHENFPNCYKYELIYCFKGSLCTFCPHAIVYWYLKFKLCYLKNLKLFNNNNNDITFICIVPFA